MVVSKSTISTKDSCQRGEGGSELTAALAEKRHLTSWTRQRRDGAFRAVVSNRTQCRAIGVGQTRGRSISSSRAGNRTGTSRVGWTVESRLAMSSRGRVRR
jgi:hypothetical protein